jgi:uncharacterized protein
MPYLYTEFLRAHTYGPGVKAEMRFQVNVRPRASKEQVIENTDGSVKVYLKTSPVDGKANRDLIAILAKHFRVKKGGVCIITGKRGRNKLVEISGTGKVNI